VSAEPLVGTHLSTRGQLATVPQRAAEMDAEAIQIFLGNPRGWTLAAGDPDADARFRDGVDEHGLTVLIHSAYLVNLGSPTPLTYERSVASVAHSLARGAAVGASGIVVHTGSCVAPGGRTAALRQVRDALLPMLDVLPDEAPDVWLEPTAGQGQSLAAGVDDLGPYLDALERHPRVRICLDTCHAFAAGHDLAVPGGMTATVDRLLAVVGHDRLAAVHANDSMDVRGAFRDRHERIGAGRIGLEPFRELLAHPAVAGIPVVLETPGGPEAHAADVALLKSLR
jgi:deoxyribonuclease IV